LSRQKYRVVISARTSWLTDIFLSKGEENTSMFLSKPLFKQMSKQFCDPKSSVVLACVIRQFFHNCPADRWSKTKECEDTLAFSKKCQDSLATL